MWDSHAHLIGNGDAASGIYVNPRMESVLNPTLYARRLFFLNGGCVHDAPGSVDRSYVERLHNLADGMRPGFKVLLFAFERAHDEQGRPNIGPFPCGGVVTINSETREITRGGQHWAFAHYSRVVRRGARRFDSESAAADLKHVALENPDGQQVLIVTNTGATRTIELRLANMAAPVPLPANSVTTLVRK